MNIPKLDKPDRYQGLYVIDFGDHSGVGYTAQEVAELLESEKYQHIKVYKIHRAYPDGKLELKGVSNSQFQAESGMFFYASDKGTADQDFKNLVALAVRSTPPTRAKIELAQLADDQYAIALIYPAEYEDEISSWLLSGNYRTAGMVEGGISMVGRYYQSSHEVIDRHQLFGPTALESATGELLLQKVKMAVVR